MAPVVRVPVLSVQMIVVLPSVSTAGSRRTRALRFAMRWAPMAREIVTTAGSASGTTATASAIPKITISTTGRPRRSPRPTTSRTTTNAARPSARPTRSSSTSSGVLSASTPASRVPMWPTSVPAPVPITTARARP